MATTPAFDGVVRTEVIQTLLAELRERYVYPEVAGRMEEAIRSRLGSGEYDGLSEGEELAEALTRHLREVSRDGHLRVRYGGEAPGAEEPEDDPARREAWRRLAAAGNFGFTRAERLAGNVGYLQVREFGGIEWAGDTVVAAMGFLAQTEALIVDVRGNGGGDPATVALLSGYLFEGSVHLNDFVARDGGGVYQSRTSAFLPGRRYLGKPVYVLIGRETFSGAEEFAYNLQALRRATVVGATSGGHAHPGRFFPIGRGFEAFIPNGRPVNPITGTDWEGTGVIPDVAVPEEEALRAAHVAALKGIRERIARDPGGIPVSVAEEIGAALGGYERGD
ncbi:MAG: hypothetical protein AVDCRST_MAG49-2844 [uncultured Thermomicrobiales bacterium]|uniref:Tail specific protease domain-containing protein n=1 Tax=uncultured Thermomicrobiales bacterium TaxID=1645740 RepID=A0A6J4UZS7_9BACT|nr:MAG: hypothetical protein AVDCRST_MAG49-2844 [uncultured Thermomicrobiales bacterium]